MEHETIIFVIKLSWHQIICTVINFYGDKEELTEEFIGIDPEEVLRLGNNTRGEVLHGNLEKHLLVY